MLLTSRGAVFVLLQPMLRVPLLLLLALLGSPVRCQHIQHSTEPPTHTLYLLGDAGEPYVKNSPLGRALAEKMRHDAGNRVVLFLGDNVYPRGLPDKTSACYKGAASILETETGFVNGLDALTIFIPGNHDWEHWGRKGLDYILNQQAWIDSLHNARIMMLPRNGCPGPAEVALDPTTVLIILDTQWWLHRWKKTEDPALCDATTAAELLAAVSAIVDHHKGKRVIIAAHHPMITYGEHGGVFTWKAHIFPLLEISKFLYIPLPVIGSVYPLYRKWFGHIQDTTHPVYEQMSGGLQRIARDHPGSVFLAGHEHAFQYIVRDSTYYVVSGSAAKTEYVKKKGDAVYVNDVTGFATVALFADGSAKLNFYQVDDSHPEGLNIFSATIPPVHARP